MLERKVIKVCTIRCPFEEADLTSKPIYSKYWKIK